MTNGRPPLHSTLPLQRSPCSRAGGSGGPARSAIRSHTALDGARARGRQPRGLDQRPQPPLGVELRPVVERVVRQRQPADAERSGAAEALRARAVHDRQAAAERGRIARAALLEPLQHEQLVGRSENLRHAHAAGLAEPVQRGRLGLVLAGRCVRARLHERAAAVVELDAVGVVDVAAADPPQRRHRATGDARDLALEAHTRARSSSSSSRQAASTMSSTVSNPRSPP